MFEELKIVEKIIKILLTGLSYKKKEKKSAKKIFFSKLLVFSEMMLNPINMTENTLNKF